MVPLASWLVGELPAKASVTGRRRRRHACTLTMATTATIKFHRGGAVAGVTDMPSGERACNCSMDSATDVTRAISIGRWRPHARHYIVIGDNESIGIGWEERVALAQLRSPHFTHTQSFIHR